MTPPATRRDEHLASTWILVLCWNGWPDTSACLDSLAPIAARGAHVVLIDNASEDGTAALAPSRYPWLEVLVNDENLGFSGGNNRGIRFAIDRGAEYIVLLNNDTVVDPFFVDELLGAAREHPEAGFLSSKIHLLEDRNKIWSAGSRFRRFFGHTPMIGHGEEDHGQYDSLGRIELFTACSVLIRKSVFDAIGLLDEDLFLYCEEVDLVLRGEAAGLSARLVPGSKVWHRGMVGTGGRRSGRYLYYFTRNMLYVLNRRLAIRNPLLRFARNTAVVLTCLASVFSQRLPVGPALRHLVRGVRDFRAGRMGPDSEVARG